MIKRGQYVKLIFRNGIHLEGTIESWSDTQSIIQPHNSKNTFVIMKTAEDVMLVKILERPETVEELKEEMTGMETAFEEVYEMPSKDDLRLKKMADLKKMMIEQERKIISEKMKEHIPNDTVRPTYGFSNIYKK